MPRALSPLLRHAISSPRFPSRRRLTSQPLRPPVRVLASFFPTLLYSVSPHPLPFLSPTREREPLSFDFPSTCFAAALAAEKRSETRLKYTLRGTNLKLITALLFRHGRGEAGCELKSLRASVPFLFAFMLSVSRLFFFSFTPLRVSFSSSASHRFLCYAATGNHSDKSFREFIMMPFNRTETLSEARDRIRDW